VLPAIILPVIDPVLVQLGPFGIRWYALAYIIGILFGWRYVRHLASLPPPTMTREQVDDLVVWITLGVILGGRLGYVLFYKPDYYFEHPLEAVQLWHGGMSFHGGLTGVLAACWLYCLKHRLDVLRVGDLVACATPWGLMLGRLANFVNSELWGRPTDVAWGMVFPNGGPEPRHPSQLYEAATEGLLLGIVMLVLSRNEAIRRRPGLLGGIFLIGYDVARSVCEFFRQPDEFLGFLFAGATMGQLLSVPLLLLGIVLVIHARRRA
jgi:phosphatidylglycerol:prolipoprotein diacylglycerol transferase